MRRRHWQIFEPALVYLQLNGFHNSVTIFQLFHNGGAYYLETSSEQISGLGFI